MVIRRGADVVVVATTTLTYTLLHVGRINNLAEIPPVPAPMDLLKFLRPPPDHIVPKIPIPIIEINSSDSHILVAEPRQASSSFELDHSEKMSTTASRVSRCSPRCVRGPGLCWIRTLIISQGNGHRGCRY